MTDRPRVVNVGGGFGGLAAAKALRHAPVDLTVVDRAGAPRLPAAALPGRDGSPVASERRPAAPRRPAPQRNANIVLAEVGGLDIERRTVACRLLDRSWELAYDSLIVAAGPRGWPFSS